MAVPGFQSLMFPLLLIAGDGQEHSLRQCADVLAHQFNLTPEDRAELLPSGRQTRFENRVGWARTYLRKAGLLEGTGWGKFKITELGLETVQRNPQVIDMEYLEQYPEYQKWKAASKQGTKPPGDESSSGKTQTPEEVLELSYQDLRNQLAEDLLARIKQSPPKFFENLVIDLLVAMGYGGSRRDAAQSVGQTGDGGIDGIIKEDKLGLDVVYIQAKRWENNVGTPVVQAFTGSLEGHHARKGVLITTSGFSKGTVDYVSKIEKKIVLINGEQLAQLLIDHGVGVTQVATYAISRVDLDYFGAEG